MEPVTFTIGDVEIEAEFDDTETARKIMAALPFEASGSYWGEEFYFAAPVEAGYDATAREVVEPGTVAFWVEGSCLCLFWGPTPVSRAGECRAASKVNVVGRVTDVSALKRIKSRKVRVSL